MLIGYARVSKAHGSQSLDLQRDALLAEDVDPARIYEDHASGAKDDRAGLEACLRALREGRLLALLFFCEYAGGPPEAFNPMGSGRSATGAQLAPNRRQLAAR